MLVLGSNHFYISEIPSHSEGRSRSLRTWGGDAVAVEGACDSAGSGRQKRVVLTPQGWRQVGGQDTADDGDNPRPDRRGEHVISRKPLRGECRVIPV